MTVVVAEGLATGANVHEGQNQLLSALSIVPMAMVKKAGISEDGLENKSRVSKIILVNTLCYLYCSDNIDTAFKIEAILLCLG